MRGIRVGLVIAGAAGLVTGQVAVASSEPVKTDQTAPAPALPNDTGKRICKVVTPTGSRFTTRVCKTEDQWKHDEEQAQNMRDQERRGNREAGLAPTPQ